MKHHIYVAGILLGCSMLLMSGCTKMLLEQACLGKPISSDYVGQLMELEGSGHHRFYYHGMDIIYDYRVDEGNQVITFDGIMQYNLSRDQSRFKSETFLFTYKTFIIIFVFTDAEKTIVGVDVRDIPTGKRIHEPIPFNVTVPYNRQYQFSVASYSAYAAGERFVEKTNNSIYLEEIAACDVDE